MKATIEIPDDLYRRVKVKSAIEGQPVRKVVMCLFQEWLEETNAVPTEKPVLVRGRPTPAWFGTLRKYAQQASRHDLTSIRRSIAQGRTHESIQPPSKGRT